MSLNQDTRALNTDRTLNLGSLKTRLGTRHGTKEAPTEAALLAVLAAGSDLGADSACFVDRPTQLIERGLLLFKQIPPFLEEPSVLLQCNYGPLNQWIEHPPKMPGPRFGCYHTS